MKKQNNYHFSGRSFRLFLWANAMIFGLFGVGCQQRGAVPGSTADVNETADTTIGATTLLLEIPTTHDLMVRWNGAIDEKYPIVLQLVVNGYNVRGSYFYKKKNTEPMPLFGTIQQDGRVELTVYDITTEALEYFKGQITGNVFEGKWETVNAGEPALNFKMLADRSPAVDAAPFIGSYEMVAEGINQTIVIDNADSISFKFQIIIAAAGCSGDAEGVAYWLDDHHAVFYGEELCHLYFTLEDKKITVLEGDCQYYHGFRCGLGGDYTKTSDEPEWKDLNKLY